VERARFLKKLREEAPEWPQEMWAASERRGTERLTMHGIDAEVAAVRRGRRQGGLLRDRQRQALSDACKTAKVVTGRQFWDLMTGAGMAGVEVRLAPAGSHYM
jgi:hypothetical protein